MSYVVEIKRVAEKPSLAMKDIERLLGADRSLVKADETVIEWSQPHRITPLHIYVEHDRLWTDSIREEIQDVFLTKLREIARYLDARVYGEEGEDLTDEVEEDLGSFRNGFAAVMGFVVFAVMIPVIAITFVFRLPWALWRISRTLK
ncbi:MAG: hypothetical protein R3337_04805 [Gammaproteobacteria bacterium]|nr:hypothetical protein [Gammaproteobacteria bacterium]